jgi:hypothetical protein
MFNSITQPPEISMPPVKEPKKSIEEYRMYLWITTYSNAIKSQPHEYSVNLANWGLEAFDKKFKNNA